MRIAKNWTDYELIDTSEGERLERWGDYILIRPDPQIIWRNPAPSPLWDGADARYIRSKSGGGEWIFNKRLPENWTIKYRNLTFKVKPTGFKHTGLFPEQAINWDLCDELIKNAKNPPRILNLFAYTGGATLACANARHDTEICHLDAVKNMVEWASENAELSSLKNRKIRWIIDDAIKFVAREKRRNSKYDAIILDPPSYGRGTNGEMWKLEDSIHLLVSSCVDILSDKPLFLMLNSYSTGLSPSIMAHLLKMTFAGKYKPEITADEIGLTVTTTGFAVPCGNTALAIFN
ncbi:MAG: class I SAM-dependent methyltransferase [Oscillospiraceae bacterium]|nr:class I SAM-dependent methyltransferase [Oscillospiraceae bacterium]